MGEEQMDLRKLRYFCRVIESGSMSRAAASLNVAQPALSKSIQGLEQDLETELLQRTSKGAVATEAGERLYEHAQIVFNQIARARSDVTKSNDRPSGHVVIGMPHSIISKIAMPILREVTERHPLIRVEITQDHSHVLAARLRSGRVDVAIMAAQRQAMEISSLPILVEELFLLCPPPTDPAAKQSMTFRQASRLNYVLPSLGNGLRTSAESHFKARSLPLNVRFEIDAIGLIPECVEAGLGSTILPGGCITERMANRLRVLRFAPTGCHRTLVISQPSDAVTSTATAAIVTLVKDLVRKLVDEDQWLGGRPVESAA
jgi:DNA-binding transcriptional LysR family regulator